MLCEKEKCTGCEACFNSCYQNAITMSQDEEGFYYPIIDNNKCNKCGVCTKVCPELNNYKYNDINKLKVYVGVNKEKGILDKSASGGVFSAFASKVILENGVVYGAAFGRDFSVEHTKAENMKELDALRNSKYVQSRIGFTYREIRRELMKGKIVLFVGTPCQVIGLKSFLKKDYHNLITIDLVCHGVPSPKFFEEYLLSQESKYNAKVDRINFRSKKNGWEQLTVKINLDNGRTIYRKAEFDPYMKAFTRRFSVRESCFTCNASRLPRVSDITISDFWGINVKKAEELNKSEGISLLLVNSVKGSEFTESIKSMLNIYDRILDDAIKENETIKGNMPKPEMKDKFRNDYIENGYEYVTKKYLKTLKKDYLINIIGKNNIKKVGVIRKNIKDMYKRNE